MATIQDAAGNILSGTPDGLGSFNITTPQTPAPIAQFYPRFNAKMNAVRNGAGSLKVLVVGDSKAWGTTNTAGVVAGPGGTSFPSQLQALLASTVLPSVIGISIPQADAANVPATDTRWVTAAGWSSGWQVLPAAQLYGIGGAASWLGTVAASDMTYTPGTTCDTCDVYYVRGAGLGTLKIADTAAASGGTSVNTATGATGVGKATITFTKGAGHIIHIGAVTVAAVAIVGIECYDSTASQIRVGNAGVVGCSAYQIADQLTNTPASSLGTIQAFSPDLTIIHLSGTIDGLYSITPAQFIQSIQAIVAAAQSSGDVILVAEPPTLPGLGSPLGTTLDLERQATTLLNSFAQKNGLIFVDGYNAFQPLSVFQTQGYFNFTVNALDAFHMSPTGNARIANGVLQGMLAATAPIATRTDSTGKVLMASLTPGTSVTASATGAASALTPTLAATAGVTNWATGFEVTGGGATAGSLIVVTVTGLVGGTLSYVVAVPTGAVLGAAPLLISFPKPIPATGVNVAVVLSIPSFGAGNTNAAGVIHGFQI